MHYRSSVTFGGAAFISTKTNQSGVDQINGSTASSISISLFYTIPEAAPVSLFQAGANGNKGPSFLYWDMAAR